MLYEIILVITWFTTWSHLINLTKTLVIITVIWW